MNEIILDAELTKIQLIKSAKEQFEALNKKLESAESTSKYNSNRASEAESEIEQLHQFLDCLPNVPPREFESYKRNKAMTRLAGWLALSK